MAAIDLKTRVREVPDFPEPGVGFKDISPLLLDPEALGRRWARSPTGRASAEPISCSAPRHVASGWARRSRSRSAAASSPRGGPASSRRQTVSATYALEYGENTLEVAADAIGRGARVVIHDDVLATGGTVEAIAGLVEQLGGTVVGVNFVIELSFLNGRERLDRYDLFSLITY